MRITTTLWLGSLALLTLTAAKPGKPTQNPNPGQAIPVQGEVVEAEASAKERPSFVSKDLLAEMSAAKAELDAQLATLTAELNRTKDPLRAIELQKEIQQAKLDNELRFFEIQATHARKVGNLELAEQAEKHLRLMKNGAASSTTEESKDQ